MRGRISPLLRSAPALRVAELQRLHGQWQILLPTRVAMQVPPPRRHANDPLHPPTPSRLPAPEPRYARESKVESLEPDGYVVSRTLSAFGRRVEQLLSAASTGLPFASSVTSMLPRVALEH
jgi:hypothetical protein